MSQALTHIALHVRDRAKSEAFYKEWGGMMESSPDAGVKSPWLSSPGKETEFALVLVPTARNAHSQPVTDVTRLGFAVESREALQALYKKAVADGIVERAYEENPAATRGNFRVHDPDGFVVEFWYAENPPLSRKFNNMSLHVRDMNVSRDFYHDWCGMDVQHYGQVSKSVRVASHGQPEPFQIVLCDGAAAAANDNSGDISHIGIAVDTKEELLEIYRRAQEAGIVSIPLMERPYPAGTLFFVRDPDNRNVEFSFGQPLGPSAAGGPS